jgi:hypothetical protein
MLAARLVGIALLTAQGPPPASGLIVRFTAKGWAGGTSGRGGARVSRGCFAAPYPGNPGDFGARFSSDTRANSERPAFRPTPVAALAIALTEPTTVPDRSERIMLIQCKTHYGSKPLSS